MGKLSTEQYFFKALNLFVHRLMVSMCYRSTSGTVFLPTTLTTTARESSWTGSSTLPAVSAGTLLSLYFYHILILDSSFSQVCQEPFFDAGLIWTAPTSQTSQPHQKHQFYDDNIFLKMWSSLCWWFDLPNAVTSVPPVPMQNAKCLILASNPLNLPFLWTVVVVFSRSCWRPAPWFLDPDIAFESLKEFSSMLNDQHL